jgi:hypothetical protein
MLGGIVPMVTTNLLDKNSAEDCGQMVPKAAQH